MGGNSAGTILFSQTLCTFWTEGRGKYYVGRERERSFGIPNIHLHTHTPLSSGGMDLINLGQEGEMYSCVDSTNLIIFKDTKKIICNFFRKLSWFFCWFDGGKKSWCNLISRKSCIFARFYVPNLSWYSGTRRRSSEYPSSSYYIAPPRLCLFLIPNFVCLDWK